MKFSILIAYYNNWNYFKECYNSIINQTYKNIEIVIVDDFSNDGTFEKLLDLSLKNKAIKLFRNSENKKVGYTKRRCVENASGEICGFLDPDDLIAKNAIELIVKEYIGTDIIATYSKIKLINSESKEIGNFKFSKKIKNGNKFFFNVNFEVAHFFTFKKEAYNKTSGIKPGLIISEDQDLYMKLYEIGKFKFIDEFFYFYRIHHNGISQNKNKTIHQQLDWHNVLFETCERRKIEKLFGKIITEIDDLPSYIFRKENTILKKLKRKLFDILNII